MVSWPQRRVRSSTGTTRSSAARTRMPLTGRQICCRHSSTARSTQRESLQVAALIELASALDDGLTLNGGAGLGSIVTVADRAGRTSEYELIERRIGGRAPEGDAVLARRKSAPRRPAGRLRPGHAVQRSPTASPSHSTSPRAAFAPTRTQRSKAAPPRHDARPAPARGGSRGARAVDLSFVVLAGVRDQCAGLGLAFAGLVIAPVSVSVPVAASELSCSARASRRC